MTAGWRRPASQPADCHDMTLQTHSGCVPSCPPTPLLPAQVLFCVSRSQMTLFLSREIVMTTHFSLVSVIRHIQTSHISLLSNAFWVKILKITWKSPLLLQGLCPPHTHGCSHVQTSASAPPPVPVYLGSVRQAPQRGGIIPPLGSCTSTALIP